jgi:hypothetical protein
MSQPTHPRVPLYGRLRDHRLIALAALLALAATAAVMLALAIGSNPSTNATVQAPRAAVRATGGPEESGVAAAISPRPTLAADQSQIAEAFGSGRVVAPAAPAPDESAVAAAVSGR